jgi:hypothetical protein
MQSEVFGEKAEKEASMYARRKLGLCGAILVLAVLLSSTVAWARVDLYTGNSGEAQWWFCGDFLTQSPSGTLLCGSCGPDYCTVADHWNVELATYSSTDDWAYIALDVAQRAHLSEVEDVGFTYKMTTVQTNSAPRMGLSLVDSTGVAYLALSVAASVQTSSCIPFDADSATGSTHDREWVWGTWTKTTRIVGGVSVTRLDPKTFSQTSVGVKSFADLKTALGTYEVKSAIVLMGVTNLANPQVGDRIWTGQTLVDNIVFQWEVGSTPYGGTYKLENPWPSPFDFDDGAETPLPGATDKPLQHEMWCTCNHCLIVDDSNLWGVVRESDLAGKAPSGAIPFASSPYALYFGNVAKGNYDTGSSDPAVGTFCSPFNELNPGDEYVSVSFSYFRQVEQYVGPFDWTYVQIKFYKADGTEAWTSMPKTTGQQMTSGWFNPFEYGAPNMPYKNPGDIHPGGNTVDNTIPLTCTTGAAPSNDDLGWKTIWYRDATDPLETGWTNAVATHYLNASEDPYSDEAYRIKVPPLATRMKIRFGFNSVDGSNNSSFGWLVDNIAKTHSPEPAGCQITTATLPQGEIGVKYDFWLTPNCQTSPQTVRFYTLMGVTKDGVSLGANLPRRLALDSCGRIYGDPDPGTSGTYVISLRLSCLDGSSTEKTLILNIRAPGTVPGSAQSMIGTLGQLPENFDGPTSAQWTVDGVALGTTRPCPNLWHETHSVKYALDTLALKGEYGSVAGFIQDDDGIPLTTSGYDPNYQCSRAKGCLMSPLYPIVDVKHDGQPLVIGFKSWRNVEFFAGGEFDETKVEVRLEGQSSWTEVWRKTSKNASLAAWEWVEIQTSIILKYGQKVQIRFCFDSVDAYGNRKEGEAYGWLIDEVSLYAGSAELGISNCPRAETSVGDYYKELITASGGATSSSLIWEISQGALPIGLSLNSDPIDRRKAYIEGIAREPNRGATFTIRVRTADWTQAATKTCSITVGQDVTLLTEDFENDPTWSLGGLWHFTNDLGVGTGTGAVENLGSTNHAAYYGRQDNTATPNYSTGALTSGMMTLVDANPDLAGDQAISLTGITAFKIEFKYWRQVESFGGSFDKTQVQVKLGSGAWMTVWGLNSSTPSTSKWETKQLGPYATGGATTLSIRFLFDSLDKWYNSYVGWLVDDIKIQSATSGVPVVDVGPQSADRLETRDESAVPQVINVPNPVTDVHTTTFMVRNPDVEAMRIRIFDLAGSLVYEEEISSNELVWHTENNFGEYLANGIYLYRASVLINGEWVDTAVQKLVILR